MRNHPPIARPGSVLRGQWAQLFGRAISLYDIIWDIRYGLAAVPSHGRLNQSDSAPCCESGRICRIHLRYHLGYQFGFAVSVSDTIFCIRYGLAAVPSHGRLNQSDSVCCCESIWISSIRL